MRAPCLNCTERKLGCHVECPKYKAFRLHMETVRQKRIDDVEAKSYASHTSYRIRRSRGDYRRPK